MTGGIGGDRPDDVGKAAREKKSERYTVRMISR
jgi:hypothetical protein